MKNFDSRVYSINDIMEWHSNDQLVLNPRFQRRSVWNDNARSYLMDTIIRGKPIPKIFMRQKLNTTTKKSIREVVDGQQRLRTIISYIQDGFQINKRHHAEYGGLYFSQLIQVDDSVQASILNYEIAVDLLVNMPDSEILDVFGRLNAYAVLLNEQERLNASHFGPFKTLADAIGHKYYEIWVENRVLSESEALRMGDTMLASDILIAMIDGIKGKTQIRKYYEQFEKEFCHDSATLTVEFDDTMRTLIDLVGDDLKHSEYRRIYLFYSLFTALYHAKYGLKGFVEARPSLDFAKLARIRLALQQVDQILMTDDINRLTDAERQFREDSRRATTNVGTRTRRTEFIVKLLLGV